MRFLSAMRVASDCGNGTSMELYKSYACCVCQRKWCHVTPEAIDGVVTGNDVPENGNGGGERK